MKVLYVFSRFNKRLGYCGFIARGCISFISLISLYLFSAPASAFYVDASVSGYSVSAAQSAAAAIQKASSSASSAAKFVSGVLKTSASVPVGTEAVTVGARAVTAAAAGVTIARALMAPAAFVVVPLLLEAASAWMAKSNIALNDNQTAWEKSTDSVTDGYCYSIPEKSGCYSGAAWVAYMIDLYTTDKNPCVAVHSPTGGCTVDILSSQVVDPNAVICMRTSYYGSYGVAYYVDQCPTTTAVWKQFTQTVVLPATESDLVAHAQENPVPDDVLNTYTGKILLDDLDIHGVTALGDPYLKSDGKTWVQDKITVTDAGTADDPAKVNVSSEQVQPNSVVDDNAGDDLAISTDSNSDTSADTNTGTGTATDTSGLCDLFPGILACDTMGDPPDDEIPTSTKTVTLTSTELGLPATCPASITVSGNTFAYPCEALANYVKPVILVLSSLIAMSIVIAALRG